MKTSDFTGLNNPKFLYRAELHHPFPDWVAKEPMPEKEDFVKMARAAFADPEGRRLPICTKLATFHSAINIFAHMDDFASDVFDRVKEACAYYDIEADVAPYAELFAVEHEKSASLSEMPDGRYAIETELGSTTYRLLPLDDAQDVLDSAVELAKMATEHRVDHATFVGAARRVVSAAEEFGVRSLPPLIGSYGSHRFPDVDLARDRLCGREKYAADDRVEEGTLRAMYDDVLRGWADEEMCADEAMEKIAAIDELAGIKTDYRPYAPARTPFDVVFGGPTVGGVVKFASENVAVGGVMVPIECFAGLDVTPQELERELGKEAAAHLSQLAGMPDARDISLGLQTWPSEDRNILLRLLLKQATTSYA
jgi:hypothetical protein